MKANPSVIRLAVPGKMFAHSLAPFFRPLRKFRLRFLCRRQREAAIPLKEKAILNGTPHPSSALRETADATFP
jgi:hypothetical protein